jgi:hypothetical protein
MRCSKPLPDLDLKIYLVTDTICISKTRNSAMSIDNFSAEQIQSVRDALASVRSSLIKAPALMAAVALAAGMSASDAHAWGNDFENLGRVIGGELGRTAGNDRYGPQARVGGLIGETLGSRMGRPADQSDKEAQRIADIQRRAREQAVRDAAYEAERRRIDPNYQSQVRSSNGANSSQAAMFSNFQRLTDRQNQLADEYTWRNSQRHR